MQKVDSLRGLLKNAPQDLDLDSLREERISRYEGMIDTNVILDVLLERENFVEESYKILSMCEEHRINGSVSASSVTDIFYLVRKYTHSTELAYNAVGKLLEIVKCVM